VIPLQKLKTYPGKVLSILIISKMLGKIGYKIKATCNGRIYPPGLVSKKFKLYD
jgi:hypothetical protein